jgi:hypothetical protein
VKVKFGKIPSIAVDRTRRVRYNPGMVVEIESSCVIHPRGMSRV